MAKDLLLEIGMEEVPARFIRDAANQLRDKTVKWLEEQRISCSECRVYATPRRLAVLATQVAEKQEDVREEVKGPSRKIAVDADGSWSKAALGFARSQGVDPDSLFFKELNGVEYVYAVKSRVGVETAQVLQEGVRQIIHSLNFPKNMRWGSQDMRFVRPIRWLVLLFGNEVVPLEIAGVTAGRITRGHRFLGGEAELASPAEYVTVLREQYVLADIGERQQLILKQLDELAGANGWTIQIKEDLLEEVTFLVEYPTALYGSFDPDFLEIPKEVLITSMREHQRYFPVLDAAGKLLPHFVTVRNGDSRALELVARGNEKVLRARLSDARFFYREDQKQSIESALSRLESIVFHEELGTVGDKVRRIGRIALQLAELADTDPVTTANVERAAHICKFDLVTQMVYEFPELQGVMGEDYARKAGEKEEVARAVFEHYQPRYSGEESPKSLVGALVSIADKIDTIIGCFSIGIIPTGSQDPYALRRQAAGIVQIMLDHALPFTLTELFNTAIRVHEEAGLMKRGGEAVRGDAFDFFALRVRNVLSERQIRYDVADAVMAAGFDHIRSVVARGDSLMEAVGQAGFKPVVESFNRVGNLAGKAESNRYDARLFTDPAEQALEEAWKANHAVYEAHMQAGRTGEALAVLGGLREPINAYFDAVMVMVEDDKIRRNRLGLLSVIAADLKKFADFQKLVWA
jgi:glycyl-tRNA synthetase beta chain